MKIKFHDGYITVDEVIKPKKITGTRFAGLLGFNKWQTPFEVWCDITKVYVKPFEETIYTAAGKAIEPKQHAYMKHAYWMDNLITPEDVYGKNYFKKTFGDFFPDNAIFGGMWDALLVDKENKPTAVLEFKTTKRVEDWKDDVPDYYGLQAALYAYLLGVNQVFIVVSFLEEEDYEKIEEYVCTPENTIVLDFLVDIKYPQLNMFLEQGVKMYKNLTTSPYYDEEKDAEIIKILRTEVVELEGNVLDELDELKAKVEELEEEIKPYKKRLDTILAKIKEDNINNLTDDKDTVEITTKAYVLKLSKIVSTGVDKKKLEEDGLLEKYSTESISYRLNVNKRKDI